MKNKFVFYKIIRLILKPLFIVWYNPKIINKEYIPKEGSIIVAGNHKHAFDQCLPIISTKRILIYMAKKEYFDSKFAWFFKSAGCISVDRSIKDEEAKTKAIEILNNGGAIGLFPEGTRNKTDSFLLPFKFGTVSMASKTDSYIVPFGITGDFKFRSKNLVAKFGEPFKVGNMTLEEANEKLKTSIENLMKDNLKQ